MSWQWLVFGPVVAVEAIIAWWLLNHYETRIVAWLNRLEERLKSR